MFAKVKESPYLEHASRLQLVEDDGEEGESVGLGCHQVRVGW